MEAKELDRLVAAAELRNPQDFSASRERYVIEISYMAGLKEGQAQKKVWGIVEQEVDTYAEVLAEDYGSGGDSG